MTELLAAAVAVLAALVLLNLALTLAMIRRLRQLSAATGTGSPALPGPGRPVPALPGTARSAGTIDPPDLSTGTHLVAVLSPTCPPCRDLADQIVARGPAGPVDLVLLVGEADDPDVAGLLADLRDQVPVLTVLGDDLEASWGVSGFPALLRITDAAVAAAGHRLEELGADEPLVAGRSG